MSKSVRWGGRRLGKTWEDFMRSKERPVTRSIKQHREEQKLKLKNVKVDITPSKAFLDTPDWRFGVGMVVVAVLAKLTMMYDETQDEARTERKAREATTMEGPQLVSRELWDELQEVRPRTPFESRISRSNARIRSGEDLSVEDVKDWAIDVLTDALAKKEDSL